MDKQQIIEHIRALNASAGERFLRRFREEQLAEYLQQLQNKSMRNVTLRVRGRRQTQSGLPLAERPERKAS
ncbi:MAG: hypothetical protein ACFCVE_12545 [Phycisphaerae bacterium]